MQPDALRLGAQYISSGALSCILLEIMQRIITAAILIPLVLLLIFKGSFVVVLVAAALVAELAAWEFLSLASLSGARPPRLLVLAAVAVLFAAAYVDPALEAPALLLVSLVLFAVCAFRSPIERVLPDTASSIFCLVYVGLSLTTIPLLWVQGDGPSLVLFLLCVVWCGDVAALYVGRAFGWRRLAPSLSPNKTWEGSAASIAGSVIAAIILYYVARLLENREIFAIGFAGPPWRWLVLAVALNLAAQVGDLAESAIKRGSGTKDSGVMLPGHGGMLDRVDALLLAAPLLWCVQFVPRYF